MSDDVLRIVPASSTHIPPVETHEPAVRMLEKLLPDGEMCEADVYENVEFIDCGENLEAIICPACGTRTKLHIFSETDAGTLLWDEIATALEDVPAAKLEVQMPCCGTTMLFTALGFDWPTAFARFELSIYNPNTSENLPPGQVALLENILGCELKQVRAHY
ncbi:hypothetical protein [Xanthomonas medicagonis]|uniref:hypothetical protein n=1 Tax=Xanthomonas medicagonis TaxID=3160841 RepID=UPI003514132A